jgi:hypothetical protein
MNKVVIYQEDGDDDPYVQVEVNGALVINSSLAYVDFVWDLKNVLEKLGVEVEIEEV